MLSLILAQAAFVEPAIANRQSRTWVASCPFGDLEVTIGRGGDGRVRQSDKQVADSPELRKVLTYVGQSRSMTVLCATPERTYVINVEGMPAIGATGSNVGAKIMPDGTVTVGQPF